MPVKPVIVQCDFDGTITIGDVSFQILDAYTGTGWRKEFDDYMQGKITVNRFNTRAFSRVKATAQELDSFVRQNAVIRPGLVELIDICRKKHFRFVIVSNGMAFYIQTILEMCRLKDIEFIAGQADFSPKGMKTWYPGPDGNPVDEGFKESWTSHFVSQGYRVIYIGNGTSDFAPARKCSHIFAIDNLAAECQKAGVGHTPFNDLNDITDALRSFK